MKLEGVAVRHAEEPCPPEKAFFFVDGRQARSLRELAEVLAEVPHFIVGYHRHHLEPWVRDVLADAPLAERVQQYAHTVPDDAELQRVLRELVTRRLDELQPDSYRRTVGALEEVKRRLAERFRRSE